jgi:hypothetical protein
VIGAVVLVAGLFGYKFLQNAKQAQKRMLESAVDNVIQAELTESKIGEVSHKAAQAMIEAETEKVKAEAIRDSQDDSLADYLRLLNEQADTDS